jgi:dynein heavy chain
VLKFSDANFLGQLGVAITNGYPVIFEEVEERLDPAIESVLQK